MIESTALPTENIARFIFAGNAVFTLRSAKTGTRYTYKVQTPQTPDPGREEVHFIKVLTGPDNTGDYQFFGTVFGRKTFRVSRKSRISGSAPSVRAFEWFIGLLLGGVELPTGLDVYHEGRCGRCGRALTVPESILTGFGPECSEIIGMPRAEVPVPPPGPGTEEHRTAREAIDAGLNGPARAAHRENRRRADARPEERMVTGETYGAWAEREAQEVGL